MRLEQLVIDAIVDKATDVAIDFADRCRTKNAAEDQRNGMYDIKHVAILGGEHD